MALRQCERCGEQFQNTSPPRYRQQVYCRECTGTSGARKTYALPGGTLVTRRGYLRWRRDNGICRDCNEPVSPLSSIRCERHHTQNYASSVKAAAGMGPRS